MSGVRTSQSDASSDMDLARAPRRTARKKGSGYENVYDCETRIHFLMNFYAQRNFHFMLISLLDSCVFLHTPFKRASLLSGHLGEVPKVSA